MPARLITLALLAQPAPATAPPAAPPAAAIAAPVTPAPPATAAEPQDGPPTAAGLEALKRVYADSCLTRAYGTYDEVCNQLDERVRAYRRELAREGRRPHG